MAHVSHCRSPRILLVSLLLMIFTMAATGCSIKKYAINKVGDSLASGGSVYESDDDLELVGDAFPFSLKLVESLLAESPRHRGLLLAATKGFASYSYIFVDSEADVVAVDDLARATELRARARNLYLRAYRYGIRGLELSYPGIGFAFTLDPEMLSASFIAERLGLSELDIDHPPILFDPEQAVSRITHKKNVPLLYWTGAALGLAISVSRNDPALLARLPEVDALIGQAMRLDESWDEGALHGFEVIFARARPGALDFEGMDAHFRRALELSNRSRAGLFVSYAEAVAIPNQDRSQFQTLLDSALAIDPNEHEENRLVNLVAQRRARWLLSRVDELILPVESTGSEGEGQ